jgi:DNA-binding NarL/FixJ family response regulator
MSSPTEKPIRILLVDNRVLIRAGLCLLIERQPGMTIAGEAGNSTDALALATQEQPDIILFEVNLNDSLAVDLIPQLLNAAKHARVILVTEVRDPQVHHQAVQWGSMGVVLKEQPAEVLVKAIRKVYAGEAWLDRMTIASVLTKMSHARADAEADPELLKIATLSERERDVIALVGQGYKNKQIAETLYISEITVRHHLTSIFSKLGIADRLELLIFAYQHGLAQLPR